MKTPKQQTPPIKMSLGLSRLYNLGNYENVKYDIVVDVPPGTKPSAVMIKLVTLLRSLRPKPPVPTYDYERAKGQLEDPNAWHKNVTPAKERRRRIKEMVQNAAKVCEEYELWLKRRSEALDLLDELGGTETGKDHKLDWPEGDF